MKINTVSQCQTPRNQPPGRLALAGLTVLLLAAGIACQSTPPHRAPAAPTQAAQATITPAEALERLKAGNDRHVANQPLARNWATARAETAQGQYPYAVILSCLDSRTSSEIIFDAGLGEVFNARVAGNVLDDDILGSMEFGCKAAGAKLIAVVGHTECGAVKGACTGVELGNLTGLLAKIQPAVTAVTGSQKADIKGNPGLVNEVARANVRLVMQQIRDRSPILREMIESGQVGLVGGLHDLDSGRVTFMED